MEALQEATSRGPRPSGMTDEAVETPPPSGRQDRLGLELQQIPNAPARLSKQLFARGPTKARTDNSGPDTPIATLENSLTTAEGNMIALGEHQRGWEIRTWLPHPSERNFVETVVRISGRTARAVVSGADTHKDVAAEAFYFEPVASTEATDSD